MVSSSAQRILLFGCGGVQSNVLVLLDKFFPGLNYKTQLVILDKRDRRKVPTVADAIAKGATFIQKTITRDNLIDTLTSLVEDGDLVIDLSVGISGPEIIRWCLTNSVNYINTALELWEDEDLGSNWIERFNQHGDASLLEKRTLYMRQENLRALPEAAVSTRATCVIDHGMNPGLVSHFSKAALEKIAGDILKRDLPETDLLAQLRAAYENKQLNLIAQLLGLCVIHVSERDTQVPHPECARKPGEFLNTWSCDGFFEEGLDPVQIGWGTHEKTLPDKAVIPSCGPQNMLFTAERGILWPLSKSFVPTVGEIKGFNIPHSESATLSQFLSVSDSDKVVYRPTVHYVYSPPDCSQESWNEVLNQPDVFEKCLDEDKTRVLSGPEIMSGKDAVGVLLMFESDPFAKFSGEPTNNKPWCYWAGTILNIKHTREYSDFAAPTEIQVASSVLSASKWILENPSKGLVWPESVSHDFVLSNAGKFLGDVVFTHVEWDAPEGLQFNDFIVDY